MERPGERAAAVKMLCRWERDNALSDVLLDTFFKENTYITQEKRFITMLFYGCIERKLTLDYIIQKYSKIRIKKLDLEVLCILRTAIYQILYMNSVPDSAAVDESVKLTRYFHRSKASGFVNGILRQFLRDRQSGKEIEYPKKELWAKQVKYSCPEKLIQKFENEYGEEHARDLLENSLGKAPITLRQNILFPQSKFDSCFEDGEIIADKNISYAYEYKGGGDITRHKGFKEGYFHIQDRASQLACLALDAQPSDEIIYDVCAAPGGKSFTIAQNTDGTVYSNDKYKARTEMISQGAKRLGLDNIKTLNFDATKFPEGLPKADKILCDVPCSGYGVIRKKPEIKYHDPDMNSQLPEIQYSILNEAAKHLKKGGFIVYSTCTLSRAENDDVCDKFISNHDDFESVLPLPDYEITKNMKYVTLFPEYFESDGFFIAKFVKI